jgi:predicted  nucleic acid-binding Zn-ribbon protein
MQSERREAAADGLDEVDDRRVVLLGHLHELRRAVEALERDLRSAERELASDRRRS